MIEVRNLDKRFGSTMAINDLSFPTRPGMVAGFLRSEEHTSELQSPC